MEPSVIVAIVAVAGVAALVTTRLRRVARDNRPAVPDPASTTPLTPEQAPLSTADRRFQLLSFQGGSVPADLRPMLEELRRNGIEVDEETLRRKLTDGGTVPVESDHVVTDHVVTDPVVSDHSPPDDPDSDGQPADGAGSEDP